MFEEITKENISVLRNMYYMGGKEIEIGDKICFGFVEKGLDSKQDFNLLSFVHPKNDTFIYQLTYNKTL